MSQKILIIAHPELIPPPEVVTDPDRYKTAWITEYDVSEALKRLGYEVEFLGLSDNINLLSQKIIQSSPNIVFNLLEEFHHNPQNDFKVVSLLELMEIKYTGCCAKGLLLSRDKALSKKILKYHKINTPHFFTFPRKKRKKLPKNLNFPLIVKCLYEEASYGLTQASIVHDQEKLQERIDYIHNKLDQDAIIEEFIAGKEFYVGLIGNKKLTTLPIWELQFNNVEVPEKEIYTSRAKWNEKYRERKGIDNAAAKVSTDLEEKIFKICKKVYQVLCLSGYARIDLRVTAQNKVYVLEANPNPNIAQDDEFARSALHKKISYDALIRSLL